MTTVLRKRPGHDVLHGNAHSAVVGLLFGAGDGRITENAQVGDLWRTDRFAP